MKKLILILILSLCLIGCSPSDTNDGNNDDNNDNNIVEKTDLEILQEVSSLISIPEEVDSDISLPTSYNYEDKVISISWESSDEEIISNDGKVSLQESTILINLTCTLTLNNEVYISYYDVLVDALSVEEIVENIFNTIELPTTISEDITLPRNTTYLEKRYGIVWTSNNTNAINDDGEIVRNTTDIKTTLTASIYYNRVEYTKDFEITILKFDETNMKNYLSNLDLSIIDNKLDLPKNIEIENINYSLLWESNKPEVISSNGKIGLCLEETTVNLTCTMSIDNVSISESFEILVPKTSESEILNLIDNIYTIPTLIHNDYYLPTNLKYGLVGSWQSSDETIISNTGTINKNTSIQDVSLTLTINIGDSTMTKTYETKVAYTPHFITNKIFNGTHQNTIVTNDGKVELNPESLEGYYESLEITSSEFNELVATWCATSSEKATCELFVSLKVNGSWSSYITYGEWGLGLKNGSTDQTNALIKLVDDEVKVLNNKYATAIKYKVVFKRASLSISSPALSLVTFALNLKDYTYDVDASLLKDKVLYDVPRLYQHDVPSIGNIICSATSSTMLLKYKGHDFSAFDTYEHNYIANLVKDYGNNIFGNWVYNCVGMSAFGETAYVKRFYSTNEFLYSIQEVGPMAASIKGTVKYINLTTNEAGQYTSSGHLLVVTGYEITDTSTYIYINDPNVRGVAIKVVLEDFLSFWRNVSYVIE